MIMEVEKAHDLLSVKCGETQDKRYYFSPNPKAWERSQQHKSQSMSESLTTRRFNVWGQEKMDIQLRQREQIFPLSTFLFIQALNGLMMPTHIGEGIFFITQSSDSNANLF